MKVQQNIMLKVHCIRNKISFKTKNILVEQGKPLHVLNELFAVNTVIDIDNTTGLPNKEKMADLILVMEPNQTIIGKM